MSAVITKGLTKRYGKKTAVDHIDLKINDGELFALLGVNGAGKTTTVRMLTCLSEPQEGEALVNGHSVLTEKDAVKAVVGISPQDTAVSEKLTVRENLELMAKVAGFSKEKIEEKVSEMIECFDMEEVEDSRAKTLSGGLKRKLSIAMALISEPKVLFLDEPTLGLDVLARRELWRAIEALKGKMTIVLTTHYMEEAEMLSDRIAIMVKGKIAALGTLAEIEAIAGKCGLEDSFVEIAERAKGGK
ncbi:MAG: ATP-binding cassette domain-containing protein [Oscillospiraceae bacterium]|nr:ATP-binding cassette domain-containing protein [Oscillospiraceae bacterium]